MTLQASPSQRRLGSLRALRWPYRVLAVDSPACLTSSPRESLLEHGLDLRLYSDGATALLDLAHYDPAAVIAPTDMQGVNFLRFVQAIVAWSEVPIIAGLASGEDSELAFQALEAGARALVGLPFRPEQLSSALESIGLTRTASAAPLRFGPIILDHEAHQVRVAGTSVHLSPSEFQVLKYLIEEFPRVVSNAEIAVVAGGNRPTNPARVRKCVEVLRRKLLVASPDRQGLIENIRGVGYRLRAHEPPPSPDVSEAEPPSR